MMKPFPLLLLFLFLSIFNRAMPQTPSATILIETNFGNMTCILYEETPMHTENFLELVGKDYFDGQLFHRVISGFMIQAGDPNSIHAQNGQTMGSGGPGYTVPAEFHPALYHKKGAIAAARQGDHINPGKASSGSQFYIVQGEVLSPTELDQMESNGSHIRFTPQQRKVYTTLGGTPHLDYAYTVFGEVVNGLDVLDQIASVPADQMNRPINDVKIFRISVLK